MILLPLSAAAAEKPIFPERHVFELEGYSIEYSEGDEELARDLLREIVAQAADQEVVSPAVENTKPVWKLPSLDLDMEEVLAEICRYLAIEEPTERMRNMYQGFAEKLPEGFKAFQRSLETDSFDPRHFSLWSKAELLARLNAGQLIPNFSADGDKVAWSLNYSMNSSPETGVETVVEGWNIVPIVLTAEDSEPGFELVRKKARGALIMCAQIAAIIDERMNQGLIGTHSLIHELVEVGIVWGQPLYSKDRRWFCDGVAEYLSYRIIANRVGEDEAKKFYDLESQLAQYDDLKDQIDLAAWAAAENEPEDMSEDEKRLNRAHYPFAAQVIANVCAKHGDDLLPKLFREIQRTPPEERNMDTVYRAYRKLTRENLRDYFPNRRG